MQTRWTLIPGLMALVAAATIAAAPGAADDRPYDPNSTIDYFAKAVDQDGRPLRGVHVGLWLVRAVPDAFPLQETYHFRAASGPAGGLALTRLRGIELQIASVK